MFGSSLCYMPVLECWRARNRQVWCLLTCVADSAVVDLDPNLVSLRGCNLDILEAQALPGLPCHGCSAGDSLVSKVSAQISLGSQLFAFPFVVFPRGSRVDYMTAASPPRLVIGRDGT